MFHVYQQQDLTNKQVTSQWLHQSFIHSLGFLGTTVKSYKIFPLKIPKRLVANEIDHENVDRMCFASQQVPLHHLAFLCWVCIFSLAPSNSPEELVGWVYARP